MKLLRTGIRQMPTAAIAIPMIRYKVRYRRSKAQIVGVSSSAIGLYMLYTIALPTPSSARFKNISRDLNKPFRPRYSVPRKCSITERITKGKSIFTISMIPSNAMFLAAFFVRSSFTPFINLLSNHRFQETPL